MNFNKLIPELGVLNLERSLKFYRDILGFKVEYLRPEDKFAFLSLEGSQIMIQEKNGIWETGKIEYPFGRGINFQIEVKDVDLLIELLKKHNYPLFEKVKNNTYVVGKKNFMCREFIVPDTDGYLLRFSESREN